MVYQQICRVKLLIKLQAVAQYVESLNVAQHCVSVSTACRVAQSLARRSGASSDSPGAIRCKAARQVR